MEKTRRRKSEEAREEREGREDGGIKTRRRHEKCGGNFEFIFEFVLRPNSREREYLSGTNERKLSLPI